MTTTYYLKEEPKPGSKLAEAFKHLDDTFGTEPIPEAQAIGALRATMDISETKAKQILHNLWFVGGFASHTA